MKSTFVILLICWFDSFAQLNVIQDGEGETSYQINKSAVTFNTYNNTLGATIKSHKWPTQADINAYHQLNVSGSFQVKNDFGKFVTEARQPFDAKIGIDIILKNNDINNGKIKNFFTGINFIYSRVLLYDPNKSTEQIYSSYTPGISCNIGYNWLNSICKKFTGGISIPFGYKSNSGNLEELDILSDYTEANSNAAGIQSQTQNAYLASEFDKSSFFSKVNGDIGTYIQKRFFVNLHITYAVQNNVKPIFNSALGVFYTKDGAPLESIIGLQLQTKDWANTVDSDKTTWQRTALVLTLGFPFD